MLVIFNLIGKFLDLLALPFRGLEPFWGFFFICLIMGTIAVIMFKYLSNQTKIKAVKKNIKTHFLEIRLYKDDFREILKAQKEILKNNFWYIIYSMGAAIPIIIVVLLTLSQLNLRYGYAPIMPGQTFDVKVTYARDADRRPEPQVVLPEGLEAVTPAMYLGGEDEVSWQVRAAKAGRYRIGFKLCDREYNKELVIGEISLPFCPQLMRKGILAAIVNSIEPPLSQHSLLDTIEIGYQPKHFKCIFLDCNMHWLLVFAFIAISFGLVIRKILKVD